jgi:group I intron endonuclease
MLKRSGIYQIENTINGKRYIGSTVAFGSRWGSHRTMLRKNAHHSAVLQRAWNKYGEASFVFKPIIVCSAADRLLYEQRALDVLRPEYNMSKKASAPDSEIISKANKGRIHTAETRAKLRLRPRPVMTPEILRRMSEAQKGRVISDEAKAKMSLAWKTRVVSEDTKKKQSAARQGLGMRLEYEGKNLTVQEWSNILGVDGRLIRKRLDIGLPIEEVLTSKDLRTRKVISEEHKIVLSITGRRRKGIRTLEHEGATLTCRDMSEKFGIPLGSMHRYLRAGYSLDQILTTVRKPR